MGSRFTRDMCRHVLFMVLAAACLSGPAQAQEVIPDFYKEPGLNSNRSFVNQSFHEHIDPFTGALQLHYVDVRVPGNGGFDLSVVRSYNSVSFDETNPIAYESQAGLGWTLHVGRVLNRTNILPCSQTVFGVDTLGNPVVEMPDGGTQMLVYSGSASPLMYTTRRWKADCTSDGLGMSVYSPDGTRYDMTQAVTMGSGANVRYAWYTTRITDRNGNFATINYVGSQDPRISSISASDGRLITFSYNSNRLVTAITTNGDSYTYSYQAVSGVAGAFHLASVTRPGGTTWQYQYNNATGGAPGSHALRRVSYPEGGTIDYGYGTGSSDYVYFDTVRNAYSRSTVVKTKSTSDGGSWSFAYSPGAAGSYDITTVNGPEGTTTYRHVGPNYASGGSLWMVGLLMEKQVASLQGEVYTWTSQSISTQMYKRPGAWKATRADTAVYAPVMASRTITRDGQAYKTTFSVFDSYGNPKTIVEAGPESGNRTTSLTYFHNSAKWVVRKVQDETVSGGVAITRSFDANGNLLTFKRDGVTTSHQYLSDGSVSQTTFPRGLIHRYSSHKRGIPTREDQPEGISVSRTVSDAGNVTAETNGEGRTTRYAYDGLNRLTRIDYPKGSPVTIVYGSNYKSATRGSFSEYTNLDGFGRPVIVRLAGSIAQTLRYDALGRRTFVSNPESTSGNTYSHDALGRVTRVMHADGTFRTITYGAGSRTVRDERNNATTQLYRAYGDPDHLLLMWTSAADSAANVSIARNEKELITSIGQGGVVRIYDYDGKGHLTGVTNPETGRTIYGRDDAGNMTSRSVGSSPSTSFSYDEQNRLVRVIHPGSTPSVTRTYSKTHKPRTVVTSTASHSYSYDENDNLTGDVLGIDSLSFSTAYEYDNHDALSLIRYPRSNRSVRYSPDSLGRPTQVSGFVGSIAYWPSGHVSQINYANGAITSYGQNNRLWPSSFRTSKGSTNHLNSNYAHDGTGNVTSITDSVDSSYNRSLSYDALDRLTGASGPWGSGSLRYDGAGNLLSQVFGSSSLSYSYDSKNRLASVSGMRSASYNYDDYGNVVGAGGESYNYDHGPNMVCARCSSSSAKVEYRYDGLGRRVSVRKAGMTTYEIYGSNGQLLVEYTPADAHRLVEHIYLGDKRVAQMAPTPTSMSSGGGSTALKAVTGRNLSLTITVNGTSPTGTLTWYEGTTLLGTATLSSGSTVIGLNFKSTGTHTIRLEYSGDAANEPSSSSIKVDVTLAFETLLPILDFVLND
jgi:YD repeat-containing protein